MRQPKPESATEIVVPLGGRDVFDPGQVSNIVPPRDSFSAYRTDIALHKVTKVCVLVIDVAKKVLLLYNNIKNSKFGIEPIFMVSLRRKRESLRDTAKRIISKVHSLELLAEGIPMPFPQGSPGDHADILTFGIVFHIGVHINYNKSFSTTGKAISRASTTDTVSRVSTTDKTASKIVNPSTTQPKDDRLLRYTCVDLRDSNISAKYFLPYMEGLVAGIITAELIELSSVPWK